jgi:methionyl-tRNA formyltransferase
MKPHVCILLNRVGEFDFEEAVHRYLPADKFEVTIAETFPEDPSKYRLILPWNYRKIIKNATRAGNVVVMHSSDLPEGRGWAPIYYAFSEQKSEHVISGILAAEEVDTGDVIVRARFPIEAGYTAPFIRSLDNELSVVLVAKILEHWPDGDPVGVRQVGLGSYRPRRYPSDNEIDLSRPLIEVLPHLRGVESASPAFFCYENVKYLIEVRPEVGPRNPGKVTIEYPALNIVEIWRGWHDSP